MGMFLATRRRELYLMLYPIYTCCCIILLLRPEIEGCFSAVIYAYFLLRSSFVLLRLKGAWGSLRLFERRLLLKVSDSRAAEFCFLTCRMSS